eukprot:3232245-Pyramimonas_sp.AAC.1
MSTPTAFSTGATPIVFLLAKLVAHRVLLATGPRPPGISTLPGKLDRLEFVRGDLDPISQGGASLSRSSARGAEAPPNFPS